MSGRKKRPLIVAGILVFIIIILPLIAVGLSFIGRIAPDSVIPDSFDLYVSVPDPVRLAERVLSHEPLPDIAALSELTPLMHALNQVKALALTENKWIRLAARGRLDAAFLAKGQFLAAWDVRFVSPLLKFLPALAGRLSVPGLYYVQAGRNSRFEYRMDDGKVFFIGPHKNLLVISDNSSLFESVLAGSSRDGDRIGSGAKAFYSRDHDIAFLLSPAALISVLGDSGTDLLPSALNLLQFPGLVEVSLSVLPNQLKLHLVTPLGTNNRALQIIIDRDSLAVPIQAMIPSPAQYLTLISAGSLQELINGVSAITSAAPGGASGKSGTGISIGAEWENALQKADSSARRALGMDLQELLFSWTGAQFAVYGLEGRPNPVVVIEIKDEIKRKEVFDKAFRTIFLSENIQLNLDGNRIPRIQVPRVSVKEEGFITISNTGKNKEIFFTGEGNALYGYSRNFNSLDGFPLPVWGRPLIEDLNGDGKIEAAGVGMDSRLYMWQFR